jgi:predicted metal-dependent phosphoesterase TrpH
MNDKMNGNRYNPKIVSMEYGIDLIKQGYFAMDPHCHSSYSYDVPDVKETSPESIIKVQKLKNLRQVLTDHDNLNGYNRLKSKGQKILPAVELTFKPKIARKVISPKTIQTVHINIFGLNNSDLTALREIAGTGDLDELILYLKQNDLDWMYNHPFFHEKKEKLNWRAIPGLAKNYFDVIELNNSFSKGLNDINQRIAEKLDKGIVASSDSHTGNPGRAFVIAEGKNFKDFWENVKSGNTYIMRKDMNTWGIVREASLIINQAFNANIRPSIQKRYRPATNVEPLDYIMKSVTSGKLKNQFITKKVIQMTLQSLNYAAGPMLAWRLHVTKNEDKAEHIRNKMQALTNNIQSLKQHVKKNDKNHTNKHSKQQHYGYNLVNHKS